MFLASLGIIKMYSKRPSLAYVKLVLFYRLFILKSEVLAPSEGRQMRVRSNFLDVLGSLDALIAKEKISGFLIYIIRILSTLLWNYRVYFLQFRICCSPIPEVVHLVFFKDLTSSSWVILNISEILIGLYFRNYWDNLLLI